MQSLGVDIIASVDNKQGRTKMKAERLLINTMGTGRWYAALDDNNEEVGRFFIEDYEVCSILDSRHSEDHSYEGAWQDSVDDEYEQIYDELSSRYADDIEITKQLDGNANKVFCNI